MHTIIMSQHACTHARTTCHAEKRAAAQADKVLDAGKAEKTMPPSTPGPAAVVQPDIGDGMRPLAEAPQKDNRIGWHACPMCDHRTKRKGGLKQHMASRHDVDVQIFSCPRLSMCDYRAKQRGNLKRHMAIRHGVDVQESDRAVRCRKCPASDDAPPPPQPQPAQLQREREG